MHRLAVLSDIHGNYPALKAVIDNIDGNHVDEIICLGDMVGYYCQVNECIDLMRKRNIHCLLGNHDYYMISGTCCESKTVKMCIDYQRTIISEENYNWLRTLKPYYDTNEISCRHGGWNDALEERITLFDFSRISDYTQELFLSGHTHKQGLQVDEKTKKVYCNPGSVGQPRDNDPRSAYLIVHPDMRIEMKRVAYNIDEIVSKMKNANQGDWIWKGLYTGEKVGGNSQ